MIFYVKKACCLSLNMTNSFFKNCFFLIAQTDIAKRIFEGYIPRMWFAFDSLIHLLSYFITVVSLSLLTFFNTATTGW